MHFLPTRCTDEAYVQYVQLFSDCFPKSDKFSSDYLDWLYRCNPDGEVIGFDAFDNDRLIAHYACIPAQAYIGGEKVNVLLSLNTATHPDYQGQGLFLKLAEMTYAAGTEQGYDCVYGIANANSTPGFTRKLMFQLVGTLTAKVGIGAMRINFSHSQPAQFQRIWSKQALEWRCANPINPILTRTTDDRTTFSAPALMGKFCMATAELHNINPISSQKFNTSPLHLFIGKIPSSWETKSLFFNIPEKLKPSPLNLIYRSLSGRIQHINIENVFLSFLDFDAY